MVFCSRYTSETGFFQSSVRHSLKHNLPITFAIEDNGESVMTKTKQSLEYANFRIRGTSLAKSDFI
jgi:hypothetical protein